MPLTEKGEKIKGAMEKTYGPKEGERVFYASKNAGKITGVDDDEHIPLEKGTSEKTINKNTSKLIAKGHNPEAAAGIAERKAREDDNQHMGFTEGEAVKIKHLVSECDALEKRMDFWEKRHAMKQKKEVKPRTKDNMQPSNRHPKKVPK